MDLHWTSNQHSKNFKNKTLGKIQNSLLVSIQDYFYGPFACKTTIWIFAKKNLKSHLHAHVDIYFKFNLLSKIFSQLIIKPQCKCILIARRELDPDISEIINNLCFKGEEIL